MKLTIQYLKYINTLLDNKSAIATLQFRNKIFNTTIDKFDCLTHDIYIHIKLFNTLCVKRKLIYLENFVYNEGDKGWNIYDTSLNYIARLEIYIKPDTISETIDRNKVNELLKLFSTENLKCACVTTNELLVGSVNVTVYNYNPHLTNPQEVIMLHILNTNGSRATDIVILSMGIEKAYNALIRDKTNFVDLESNSRLYINV